MSLKEVPVNKDSKTVNDVEPALNQRDFVIPKLRNVKKKKEEPLTVKTELFTKAEFIASQISPPKVYCPPHVISS